MIFNLLFFCLTLLFLKAEAASFFYPIFYDAETQKTLFFQQKNGRSSLFWLQQAQETTEIEPATQPLNQTLYVSLFPDHSGYSFIDEGILKIREFDKRSPMTLLLDTSLTGLNYIHWYTQNDGIGTAFLYHKTVIFSIHRQHTQGIVTILRSDKADNCILGHKKEEFLFYVSRTKEGDIVKQGPLNEQNQDSVIFKLPGRAVQLQVQDEKTIFVTVFDTKKKDRDRLTFNVLRLSKDTLWTCDWLLDFELLLEIVDQQDGLLESFNPLLPVFETDGVVFNTTVNGLLIPCFYSFLNKTVNSLFPFSSVHSFFTGVTKSQKKNEIKRIFGQIGELELFNKNL